MDNNVKSSIIEAIGFTQIVELQKIQKKYNLSGKIFCKLEYLNPSHSKKDRMAKGMIQFAKERGDIKPGQMIVEATSGNTGIALSMICAYLDHPFTTFMSEGNSKERIEMMKFYGTNVIIISQNKAKYGTVSGNDFNHVKNAAKKYAKDNDAYFVNQFENMDNMKSQSEFGREIVSQLSGHSLIGVFCDYVGTGGSFSGTSKELKKWNPECNCYIIEPENSRVLNGDTYQSGKNHIIQGGGYGYGYQELPNINRDSIDGFISISDDEAKLGMKELATVEGIFGSFSSGANLMATIKAMRLDENKYKHSIFSICDTGLKYLSVIKTL
jgi:cysteine synthase